MPEISEKDLLADKAMLDSFSAETAPAEEAPVEGATEEAEGLDYYYNMMLPELEQAAPEEILGFVRKVLGV